MAGHSTVRCAIAAVVAIGASTAQIAADSNVASTQKFAWGENVGWLNFADANGRTQGVQVYAVGTTQYLKGWIWGENIGWINVGNGNAPYANTDNTNFGVNINPTTGVMHGLAWGENVGWIVFDDLDIPSESPRWDHAQHRSHGYAWGENIGWINLEDAVRFICAMPGDADFNGTVDIFDFAIMAQYWARTDVPEFTSGDCDGNGTVDIFDFAIFAQNFSQLCP